MTKKLIKEWHTIAGESGECEQVGESYFYYGSRGACRNLEKHYGGGLREYSPRIGMWFYTIKISEI